MTTDASTNVRFSAFFCALLLHLVAGALLSGCAPIAAFLLHESRTEFNETAQNSSAEQLLRNIVRLRYASSTYFLDIASVSTSATMTGNLGGSASVSVSNAPSTWNLSLTPGVSFSQTPSFVFQPVVGEKLARQLLRPIDMRTLALLRTAGWTIRDILLVLVDSINGIPNAPAATHLAPQVFPDNTEFRKVARLLEHLEGEGLVQLGVEPGSLAQDPRADIALSLQIDQRALTRPEVQELIGKLSLDASHPTYRLVAAASGGGGRNIAITPRSMLAAMRFLSKAVEVPQDHVRQHYVPTLPDASGGDFDWQKLFNGAMRIRSSATRPESAYVSVLHEGYWFYLDKADIASKHIFALTETALALQAGDIPPITTVLTLPLTR